MSKLFKLLTNKVFLYISSRYFTYVIQFITSIYIAVDLGAYYFGVYGFVLLLISYLSNLNFGITHSATVLLVQNKKDEKKIKDIVSNSILIITIISLFVIIICLFYNIFQLNYFEKFNIDKYFWFVPIIAILGHFNVLFLTIYRFKNKLFEIAFYQSFRPFLVFVSIFLATEENLLYTVLSCYTIGELISFLLFILRRGVPFEPKFSFQKCKKLIVKGLYLFIYISSYAMVVISTRTFISYYYSVEDFGFFTFSYSLANVVLLFLQAFTFIIMPKVLDKLNSNINSEIILTIENINTNYNTFSYLLLFVAITVFPYLLNFFPEWKETLLTLNITMTSIIVSSNAYLFSSFLMAKNKERLLSLISVSSLVVNILFSYIFIVVLNLQVEYAVLSILISYFLFGLACSYFTYKSLTNNKFSTIFSNFFPTRLLIPYSILMCALILDIRYATFISLLLLLILNIKELKIIINSIKKIITNSNIINLR
jgi:O-antigen/teichoic acid export membrane protein